MDRRGFTLMEILIAMMIVGIIMLTIYGALSRAISAKNHAEETADLYSEGREAVLKIADELEGALPPSAGPNIGFVGVSGTARVPTDSVYFDMVVRRLVGPSEVRGGRALVSYSLDPVKDRPSLFALRRQEELLSEETPADADPSNPDAAAAPAPVVLSAYVLDAVAGLRLRYLDPISGDWQDAWDTTVDPKPGQPLIGLPGAVQVTIFLADSNGGVHDFGTTVDLPLANIAPTPAPIGGLPQG